MKNHILSKSWSWRARAWQPALVIIALLMLAPAGSAWEDRDERGNTGIFPAQAHPYGKSLAEWLGTYWRWYYAGANPAQGMVGDVLLMPLPVGDLISGTGTPADPALYRGKLEITVTEGTPFVLPEFAWVGERYQDYPTVPDDLPISDRVLLAGVYPKLTIDGKTVLSDANKAAYYVPVTPFDPIVVYPTPSSYGSVAALFFQGDGIVSKPLPLGRHVIHLYRDCTSFRPEPIPARRAALARSTTTPGSSRWSSRPTSFRPSLIPMGRATPNGLRSIGSGSFPCRLIGIRSTTRRR